MATNQQQQTGVKMAIGAVVLYLILKAIRIGNFANNVNVVFKSFRFGVINYQAQVFATFEIQNPTSAQVTINSIIGSVKYQQQVVANVFFSEPTNIAPFAKTNIEVSLFSNFADLISLIQSAISGSYRGQIFFVGNVTVNGFPLPVNINLA